MNIDEIEYTKISEYTCVTTGKIYVVIKDNYDEEILLLQSVWHEMLISNLFLN